MGRLGLVEGKVWARYLAPLVFLLAVTGVVLAVRAGLRSDGSPATTTATAARARTVPSRRANPVTAKRYYVIRSGDTLGAIAAQVGTSVAALLRLNPGVEPTTLRPGRRLRVR
ncbi:MAG: LysM peptidoglycan-binding domain-containing protein [Verrucomicrobiota bacterium]